MKCPSSLRKLIALSSVTLFALALSVRAQTIPNPSFEADTFTVFPGYITGNGAITGWTANNNDRVGLNPAGSSPFADNGTIPDGVNVAFIQNGTVGGTTLSTTISGLTPGTVYKVTFRCNARNGQTPILKVEIDGTQILGSTVASVGGTLPYKYFAFDFTAAAASQTLTLRNDADPAGDNTVCVDDFHIAPSTSGWSYAAWTSDADSGVDGSKTYTHAYNFGRSGASTTINGVTFTGHAGANPAVAGSFSTAGLPNVLPFDDVNNVTGASRVMATDFVYGPGGNTVVERLNIDGLFAGGEYLATIYSVGWEDGPVRAATFSLGNDRLTVNQDHFGNNNGIRVSCHFVASSSSVALVYEPLQAATFHTYGFSVQQISLPSAPTIGQQPRSQCVGAGDTVTFSVTAVGSQPLSFKWRKGSVDIDPPQTASTLTLSGVTTADAGAYSVVVSNPSGSVTSDDAILQVGIPIVNHSFEADNFTVSPGYVSGNGPITGWTALGGHGVNPGVGFSPFADNGAIPDGSKVAFMQQDGALSQMLSGFTVGHDYYVVYYENARGGGVPAIELKIGDKTIVAPHLRPPVGGANPYVKVTSDVFTAEAGTLQLSFIKSNPQGGDTTALIDYLCVLELPPGTPPTITAQPQDVFAIAGSSATFAVTVFGSQPFTYEWRKDGTRIDGATGNSLTFNPVTAADQGLYSVVVNNATGISATSRDARLTVDDPIPGLYNTGVNNSRGALPDGEIDPHYTLIVNADLPSTNAIVEDSAAFPIVAGPWLANTAASKWIGPRLNTAPSQPGRYVYRTTIDLTDRDLSTVLIQGRWAVDNTGTDLLVNGTSTGNAVSPGFSDYTDFSITPANATFVAGINTIDFVTDNIGPAKGWTGLRVEILRNNAHIPPGVPPRITTQPQNRKAVEGDSVSFDVTASGSLPLTYKWKKNGVELPGQTGATLTLLNVLQSNAGRYSVVVGNDAGFIESDAALLCIPWRRVQGVVFGTGVDDAGALLPTGAIDLHYILAASVDPAFQGPDAFVVDDSQFPIPPWIGSGPKSKWIAPQTVQTNGNMEGDYTYQTFFDLTGYDVTQVRVVGQWAVDNTGSDILVNGVSTGITSPGFGGFTPFVINSGLNAGANQLDFKMNNAPPGANPTGLRVDLELQQTIQPRLTITPLGGTGRVSWTPSSPCQVLYSADSVTGPWTPIQTFNGAYSFDMTTAQFFKVIEQ